jgi:uncharacterized membrane protein
MHNEILSERWHGLRSGGCYYIHRGYSSDEKKAIQQAKIHKINNDANWEASMADATKSSWKDEWFVIVLSMPLLGIAYGVAMDDPKIIDRVDRAFDVLSTTPEFYQQMLFIAVLASFGIKAGTSFFKK